MGWFSGLATLVSVGANLYGTKKSIDANEKAAEKVAEAERERTAAIREGNEQAQERYDQVYKETGPARNAVLQAAGSNPYELTSGQISGLNDVRRSASAGLAASGLRGAGRAVTQSIKDVESNYRDRAYDSNRQRTDNAALYLAGKGYGATEQNAALDQATGRSIGDSAVRTAENSANASIANEGLRGAALGNIASYAADELKRRGRDSKYDTDSEKPAV